MQSLEDAFALLAREGEAAKAAKRQRSQAAAPAATTPRIDKLKLLHEKRVQDLASLAKGILPGGWELEGLVMQVCEYQCSCCGSVTRAMNPPEVFQVMRQVRHHETKFMRPLREGELSYFLHAVRAEVHVERTAKSVPLCQVCEGVPFGWLGDVL